MRCRFGCVDENDTRRHAEGMRLLRVTLDTWWVPVEHVLRLLVVLHAFDVAYGSLSHAAGMGSTAAVLHETAEDGARRMINPNKWDMFPDTIDRADESSP